jgi:hypothetical protein
LRCSPTVANDRTSVVYNIDGSRHQIRGTKWENSMVGTRLVGVAWEQLDFSLNYLFKRTDPGLGIEWAAVFDAAKPGTGTLRADLPTFVRGQEALWFDRCLRQNRESVLLGGDTYGYNSDANPDNDRSGTLCLPVFHFYPWTHIVGFTAAYNDADYTGAVFRVEESWSTKEPRNFGVGLGMAEGNVPCPAGVVTCPGARALRQKSKADSAVWRSMVGIDWPRTLPFLPGTFGRDRWFLTLQQYITYQNDNRPTHLNALTNVPRDRLQRWEQLYTLSGAGFFAGGRLEPLWAYGYSVNAKQHLFLIQALWRGLYFRNVDLLVGLALYPGSRFRTDASFLNFYADRDTAWIRLQYTIL